MYIVCKTRKSVTRFASTIHNQRVEAFKTRLDELFDVAHQDALKKISEEEAVFVTPATLDAIQK